RGEDLDCYEAWSVHRYCRCFIKTLRPDAATDASARRHLAREARLLLSLTHPHLVRAYDYVTLGDGQPPLLVLENLTGATLSYLLDGGRQRPGRGCPARLGVPDLGHLGQHLCSALRYLHSRGHLHLDVKPSNIIASDGIGKLIDLSLARRPGRCAAGIGTPGYMSPEQVCGGHLGPPRTSGASGWCSIRPPPGSNPSTYPTAPPQPARIPTRWPAARPCCPAPHPRSGPGGGCPPERRRSSMRACTGTPTGDRPWNVSTPPSPTSPESGSGGMIHCRRRYWPVSSALASTLPERAYGRSLRGLAPSARPLGSDRASRVKT